MTDDLLALTENPGRKRNWRGRFVKGLRQAPPESCEFLIWSHYHALWHRRDATTGGACGYTNDVAHAGLFERAKADSYNDGDRNEAFHVSEKLPLIDAAIRQHNEALQNLLRARASQTPAPKEGDEQR